ncbi:MAG: DUF362 domain-containing protein [Candidatus Bathyarchaeota archaeon]|nr:DUF362 domain-containing protein [Candidatus Bathyarchaeota archaeon]MDH5689314.1 DUF362 domain-containing protein [Candidatus Bathyarchaeota archaeon]
MDVNRSKVSITRENEIECRTIKAANLIGGLEKVVGRGDRVLIKPNMVGGLPPEVGETTHPEAVMAVVKLALDAGAREAVVGESEPLVPLEKLRRRFVNRPFPQIPETLYERYKREVEKAGGRFIDFNVDGWETVEVPDPVFFEKVQVARVLLECDVFIGVPALKTHHLTGITVAIKNLYGAIPREDKRKYHRLDRVEEAIVDLNQVRSSDMVIVDGTCTILHWGMVDEYLETHQLNLTIAGFDPVAVDAVSSKVLGIDPRSLRFLSWAEKKGLGKANLDEIDVVGMSIDEACQGNMMTSVDYMNKRLSRIHLANCGACTGCFGRIATAVRRVDDSGMDEDVHILMGPEARPLKCDGHVFLCGDCAIPTFYNELEGTFIPGCPPGIQLLLDHLRKLKAKI